MAAPYRLSVPSGYTSPFVDVQSGDWYYKYVAVLNSQGMIDGYGDGQFGPNDALTSGAALVMVLKAAGSGAITPSGAHWASGYADYAVEKGYLTREEIGDLDAPIRRELIAQLAARALKLEPSQGKSPFADVDDGELTALYELGIITGSQEEGKTVFLPDKPMTRAEISVIVWQVDRVHRYGKQIPFQGAYYDILPDVPVNSYDPEGFGRKNGVMYYKENGVDVARGVDVSVHQGEIDWTKVADAGIEFAMIRVGYRGYGSEGKMMGDTYFQRNIQSALDAGLKVGVYYCSRAVSVEAGSGQMVWVSSSAFLDDKYNALSSGANVNLGMNALSSLVGGSEAMAIRSKSLNYNYLTISESTSSLLKVLMIGIVPLAYLGVGIAVVVKRRRMQNEAV